MFFTFEGIDCCGKTTQVKLLVETLKSRNLDFLLLREPGGTVISERIREILLDKKNHSMTQISELLLFSASRAQLVNEVIKPSLSKNTIVICDRYVDSTTAYQGFGRGLPLGAVKTINRVATMDVMPKKTFFLDISLQEMHTRRNGNREEIDRMEMGTEEFYHRVRDGYLEMAKSEPNRFITIDGTNSIESIQERIWETVQNIISP
jgi:dTMP kinase